ncbi:hypothetical protein DFP72DRAFT_1072000 [Ephemerocybe angulata]|uniref:Uncharacterized protein n=1 Tax=Ephemerocybe angulata TaxID=980116 RepID=A0A8H6M1E7_9AGAR|nr:hypothetical protein DFP72DRAFT_1072000 [Tulosesus angulatus]
MDHLGFFVITCSKKTLLDLVTVVEKENEEYDKKGGHYNRCFQFDQGPFSNAEYKMVILHPNHFLPVGSTIAMHTKDPSDTSHLIGKLYMIAEDGALREGRDHTSPRFSAFPFTHSRESDKYLNPILIILNAEISLRRFYNLPHDEHYGSLCWEYQELIDLTIKLAGLLYHPLVADVATNEAVVFS